MVRGQNPLATFSLIVLSGFTINARTKIKQSGKCLVNKFVFVVNDTNKHKTNETYGLSRWQSRKFQIFRFVEITKNLNYIKMLRIKCVTCTRTYARTHAGTHSRRRYNPTLIFNQRVFPMYKLADGLVAHVKMRMRGPRRPTVTAC